MSASTVFPLPSRVLGKKLAKVWSRKNAMVVPLNTAAPAGRSAHSEWTTVDVSILQDFGKLHQYYGVEVRRAREEWLRGQAAEQVEEKEMEKEEETVEK